MQIILASAKMMNDRLESAPHIGLSLPRFQNEAQAFAKDMAQYSTETVAEMLGCSHQIAAQNKLRFMQFFDDEYKRPAILAYHGQAYKHLKAETLTVDDFNYSQKTLWITSFLYGLLRPMDGILPSKSFKNLYINTINEDKDNKCFILIIILFNFEFIWTIILNH